MAPPPNITHKTGSPAADGDVLSSVRARVVALAADPGGGAAVRAFLTDDTVRRYLVANDGGVEAASRQLLGSWEWQQRVRPHELLCPACCRNPSAHSLRPVGFDAQHRLVLYTCFDTARDRFDPAEAIAHLTRLLSDAQRLLDSDARLAPKWVLFIDFYGYSLRDNDPRTATHAVWLLSHFPERLGLAVLYDAGRLFDLLWRAIRRLLKPATASKVSFVGSMQTADPNVLALGEKMVSWLAAEAAENRTAAGRAKRHWEARAPGDGRHDPRGLDELFGDPRAWDAFASYAEPFVDAPDAPAP